MRRIGMLLVCLAAPLAVAAPVPKDTTKAKLQKLYGEPIDPENHCEFTLDATDLVVKMSAGLNASALSLKGSPRTAMKVTGNFEAVVAVHYSSEKDPTVDRISGHLGGGLALWESENANYLVNRHHWPSVGAANGSNWSGGFDVHGASASGSTSHGATCGEIALNKSTHLKFRRVGKTITTEESRDGGKTWNRMTKSDHEFANSVAVGICVFNTTGHKGTVTFSGLTVTPVESK